MAEFLEEFGIVDSNDENVPSQGNNLNAKVLDLDHAWQTEVNSPEILPYRDELIDGHDGIMDLLRSQKGAIEVQKDEMDSGDSNADAAFTLSFYEVDYERTTYSLTRYLRARLLKIEKHLDYILQQSMDLLSEGEKDFASNLSNLNADYRQDQMVDKIVQEVSNYNKNKQNEEEHVRLDSNSKLLKLLKITDMLIDNSEPNLNGYVFCVSNEEGGINIDNGAEGGSSTLEKSPLLDDPNSSSGEVQLRMYRSIKEFVHQEKIYLL